MKARRTSHSASLAALLYLAAAVAADPVQFSVNYLDAANVGFKDPTSGPQRQAAFQAACNTWSNLLVSSYAGETVRINASFALLASNPGYLTLGGTDAPPMWRASFTDGLSLAVPQALEDHLYQRQVSAGTPEVTMQFNTVAEPNFYFGTTGQPGTGQYDFTTIATHEIGHGLGFISGFQSDGSYGYSYLAQPLPTIYDYYLAESTVQNGTKTYTPLIDMTSNSQRATAMVGSNLVWTGTNGAAANGDAPVELYAPATYQPGSSTSHVDETLHPNDLMSPIYSGVDHEISPIDVGMMQDMLWDTIPEPEPALGVLVVAGVTLLTVRRRPARE